MNSMNQIPQSSPLRILIASSHPLFAQGINSLLSKRQEMDIEVLGMVASISEAVEAINSLHPDLVIVDYDDEKVNREEFLARFVEGEGRLRVVLFSLKVIRRSYMTGVPWQPPKSMIGLKAGRMDRQDLPWLNLINPLKNRRGETV